MARVCYEAGPTGCMMYWRLSELGARCEQRSAAGRPGAATKRSPDPGVTPRSLLSARRAARSLNDTVRLGCLAPRLHGATESQGCDERAAQHIAERVTPPARVAEDGTGVQDSSKDAALRCDCCVALIAVHRDIDRPVGLHYNPRRCCAVSVRADRPGDGRSSPSIWPNKLRE